MKHSPFTQRSLKLIEGHLFIFILDTFYNQYPILGPGQTAGPGRKCNQWIYTSGITVNNVYQKSNSVLCFFCQ